MRIRLIAALLFSSSVVMAAPSAKKIENMQKMTVLITKEGFLESGRGSGILLDEKHVLTAAHMIDSPTDTFFIYTYPLKSVITARVEMSDARDDVALLVLDSSATVRVKPVLQASTYDGEPVTVVGNALGSMKWMVTRGVLSGTEGVYLITDATTQHGNSGGPWFNDKGEVIAITNWGLNKRHGEGEEEGITGGLSAKRIIDVLHQYDMQTKMMNALMGLVGN